MKEMKLLQCLEVFINEMKKIEEDKEELIERNTTNSIIKKTKRRSSKKLLEEKNMVAQCIDQIIL